MFASLTAHATAMLPILLALGLAMPGVPFEKLALMLVLAQGLMGVLTAYATGPAPVYANSGYIRMADYWRLGTIFRAIFLAALLLLSIRSLEPATQPCSVGPKFSGPSASSEPPILRT
jgi:L-tartrate/succinate antiporter